MLESFVDVVLANITRSLGQAGLRVYVIRLCEFSQHASCCVHAIVCKIS